MPRKGYIDIRTGTGKPAPEVTNTVLNPITHTPEEEGQVGYIDSDGTYKTGLSPEELLACSGAAGLTALVKSHSTIDADQVVLTPLPPFVESKNVQGGINEIEGFAPGEPPKLGMKGFATSEFMIMSGIPDWGILKLNDNSIQKRDSDLYDKVNPNDPASVYPYYLVPPAVASDPTNTYMGADPITDPMFNSCLSSIYNPTIGSTGFVGTGTGQAYAGGYPLGSTHPDVPLQRTDRLLKVASYGMEPSIPFWQPCAVSGMVYPADRGVLALLHFPANTETINDFTGQDLLDRCIAAIVLGQGLYNEGVPCGSPEHFAPKDGEPGGLFCIGYDDVAQTIPNPLAYPGRATGQFDYWEICTGTNANGQDLPEPWNLGQVHTLDDTVPIKGQVRLGTDPAAGVPTLPYGIPILGAGAEAYDSSVPLYTVSPYWAYVGNTLIILFPIAPIPVETNFFKYRLPCLNDYSSESGLPFTPKGVANNQTLETKRYFSLSFPSAYGMFTDPTYNNPWKWHETLPTATSDQILYYKLTQAGNYPDFKQDNWNWQIARYRHNFFIKPAGIPDPNITPPSTTRPNDIGSYWMVHFKTEASFEAFVRDGDVSAIDNIYGAHLVGDLAPANENVVNQETGEYPAVRPPFGPAPDYGYSAWPYHTLRANIRVSNIEHQNVFQSDITTHTSHWTYNGNPDDGVMWCSGVAYFLPTKISDASKFFSFDGLDITVTNAWIDSYRTDDKALTSPLVAPALNSSPNPAFIGLAPFSYGMFDTTASFVAHAPDVTYQREQHLELPFTALGSFDDTNAPIDSDSLTYTITPFEITFLGDPLTPAFSTNAISRIFIRRPLMQGEWETVVQPTESYSVEASLGDPITSYGQGLPITPTNGGQILFHSTSSPALSVTDNKPTFGNFSETPLAPYKAYDCLLTVQKDTHEYFLDETYRYQADSLTWSGRAHYAMSSYTETPTVNRPVVMFGGETQSQTFQNDTWIWENGAWTYFNALTPPSARSYSAMATDDITSGNIILFGGRNADSNTNNDTWKWNYANGWSQLTPLTPDGVVPTRCGHGMATGASSAFVLMFGGRGASGYLNDTWGWFDDTFQGSWNSWDATHLTSDKPTTRELHGMSSEISSHQTILFGGTNRSSALGDTWIFNGVWEQKTIDNRYGHSTCYDIISGPVNNVFIFGGIDSDGNYRNDTWVWESGKWTKKVPALTTPSTRAFHAATLFGSTLVPPNYVVIFGGMQGTGSLTPSIYVWDGSDWISTAATPGPAPTARQKHAMVCRPDGVGGYEIIMFGGIDAGGVDGEMWVLTWAGAPGTPWLWTQKTTTLPNARYGHAMIYRSDTGDIVLFGGNDGTNALNDTWVLPIGSYNWVQKSSATGPAARYGHSMAINSMPIVTTTPDTILMFGGFDQNNNPLQDMWRWDGNTWEGVSLINDVPAARGYGSFICLPFSFPYTTASTKYMVFGGGSSPIATTLFGDTVEFDYTYKTFNYLQPPPRYAHAQGTNDTWDYTLIQGGIDLNATVLSDTWKWDSSTDRWLKYDTDNTPTTARYGHHISAGLVTLPAPAYDTLLFGGKNSILGYLKDTWIWNASDLEWAFQATPNSDKYLADITGPGLPYSFPSGIPTPTRIGSSDYFDTNPLTDIYQTSANLSWMYYLPCWEMFLPKWELQIAGLPDRNPFLSDWVKGPFPSTGLLKYPNTDYSTGFSPDLINDGVDQPDYSSENHVRSYVRCLDAAFSYSDPEGTAFEIAHPYDPEIITRNSFCLRIDGIQLEDFLAPHSFPVCPASPNFDTDNGTEIAVLVKIPGKTNWMDAGLPNVTNGNLNAYQMTTAVDFSTSTTILVPGDMTQFTDIDFTPTVQLAVTDTVVVNPAATNSAELLEKLNKAVDFIGNVQADGKITITARHLLDSPYKFPLEVADGGTLRRTATQVSWTFDVNAAYPLEYTTYSGIIPDPFPGYYDPTSPPPLLRPTFLINLGTNKHPIRYAAKQNIIVRIISDPFTTRMPLTISNWTLTKDFWTGSGEDAIVFVVNNNDAAPILEGIFQVEVSVLDPAYQLHPESEGGDPLPIIISEVVDLDVVVIKTSSYISKNNPSLDGAGCLLFGDKTFNGVDSETGMVYCQIEIDNHDADGTLALFYGREHLVGRVRHEVPVMVKIMMFGRNELPLVEGEYDLTTAVDGSATGPGTSASLIRGVTGIRILHPNDIQRQEG